MLASLHEGGRTVRLWEAATGKPLHTVREEESINDLVFSPDGRTLAAGSALSVRLWDTAAGEALRRFEGQVHDHRGSFAFVDGGKTLLTQDRRAIRRWDVATGKELPAAPGHLDEVRHLAFAADGRTVATGGLGESIRVWEVATGKQLCRLRGHEKGFVSNLALSADGKTLASYGAMDLTIRLWDATTGRNLFQFKQVPNVVNNGHLGVTLSMTPDSKALAVASVGSSTVVWHRDTPAGREQRTQSVEEWRGILSVALSPDGRTVAVSADTLDLWDVDGDGTCRTLDPEGNGYLVFSHDGKVLASFRKGSVRLWEMASRKQIHQFEVPAEIADLTFTPAGGILAVGPEDDDKAELWDVLAGRRLHRFQLSDSLFRKLALSPDGRTLATALDIDTTALLWDLSSLGPKGNVPPVRLRDGDLSRLWADLAGPDAPRGYRAVRTLSAAPNQAVPFLRERLRPVPDEPHARLIADLGSGKFAVREAAVKELARLGFRAEAALRKALREKPPLEVRRRAESLLALLDKQPLPPEQLRQTRAVQVLEQTGTAAARQVLATLAEQGAPDARLTRDAKASLERLARRPGAAP
jgi:WD40 repeat protein